MIEQQQRREPEYGSDLVVELLHTLGIEYAAFNPGASFRGLRDSLVAETAGTGHASRGPAAGTGDRRRSCRQW